MDKLFLYDPGSVTGDTILIMKRKGYTCVALTYDPDFFWETISEFDNESIFVLLSHGNEDGPLAIKGNEGDPIDLKEFAALILKKEMTLYLLSCHTGKNPCGKTLTDAEVDFVAPLGFAVFQTTGSETVQVYSKEDGKYPGWAGPLSPGRASRYISLP